MTEQERAFAQAGRYIWGHPRHRRGSRALGVMQELHAAGFAPATSALGGMYYDGFGVKKDRLRAYQLHLEAAEKEWATSECAIGNFHSNSRPRPHRAIPVDEAASRTWYRRAAARGNWSAMVNLGGMLRNGWGGEVDHAEAYVWLKLAAHCRGGPDQMLQNALYACVVHLEPAALAEADALVAGMATSLPNPRADNLCYWRMLAGE